MMNRVLTPEEYLILKNAVLAVPELAALPHYPFDGWEGEHFEVNKATGKIIGDYLNATVPTFYAWKTSLYLNTIYENGFDWVQVDNLTVGKARIWDWLFGNGVRGINPSKPNVRAGIEECWKGNAAMLAVRAAVLNHCKMNDVLRAESLLAVGSGTFESPAVLSCRGTIYEPWEVLDQVMGWLHP